MPEFNIELTLNQVFYMDRITEFTFNNIECLIILR